MDYGIAALEIINNLWSQVTMCVWYEADCEIKLFHKGGLLVTKLIFYYEMRFIWKEVDCQVYWKYVYFYNKFPWFFKLSELA